MLPFEPSTLCCELKTRHILKMPRVVSNQRAKFENDEIFRKLSRECEVRYTGYRDRSLDERQLRFQTECREGHSDLAFVSTGTNLQLNFSANAWSDIAEERVPTREFVNFDREPGKVHLKSQFILNGVCVIWRGWVDLDRLDGIGSLEFDEERAEAEDALLREQIEEYERIVNQQQEFEERQRRFRQEQERQAESEAEGPLPQGQGRGWHRGTPLSTLNVHDKNSYLRLIQGSFGKTVFTRPRHSLIKVHHSKAPTPVQERGGPTLTDHAHKVTGGRGLGV